MNNFENAKKCRIVKFINHYYVVKYDSKKWINLDTGDVWDVDDSYYKRVTFGYNSLEDLINNKPSYTKEIMLDFSFIMWVRHLKNHLQNVKIDTLTLTRYSDYVSISFRNNDDVYDFLDLPYNKHLTYDFTSLELGKEYSFKELDI